MPKVLIIEDHEKLAHFIQQFLQKKGVEADLFLDGFRGLGAFSKGAYDLLIIDLELPLMDGRTLCQEVRSSEKGKDLPIIMMSGAVKDPADMEALTKEFNLSAFFTKPFQFDQFAIPVREALTKRKPAAPPAAPSPAPEENAPQAVLKGRLSERPFDMVLNLINNKKLSGTLLLKGKAKRKKIFFLGGAPLDLLASPEEENFGNYLLQKGLVSMVELSEYESLRKKERGDPRNIFIQMGCLSPEKFAEENRHYIIDNLVDAFSWQDGLFAFEPKPSFIPFNHNAAADLPLVFFTGFGKHAAPARTNRFFDEKSGFFLSKSLAFYQYQSHLAGNSLAGKLLALIDGTRTCSDIIGAAGGEDQKALVFLFTLDALKMLSFSKEPKQAESAPPFPIREREVVEAAAAKEDEFEDLGEELSLLSDELEGIETMQQPGPEAASGGEMNALEEELKAELERVKGKNYYEVFRMTPNSYSFNSLKKTYFEITRKFSPDKFFASSGEMMSLDEELLSIVAEAYETLSNVVSKESYDEHLDSQEESSLSGGEEDIKMKLQIQFQSGKIFLEEGQYDGAKKAFSNCIEMAPKKPEYLAYMALAIYNNPANRGSKATTTQAKDLINKSLALGKLSIAYALKGAILFDDGNLSLAEAEFNKALKINPNNRTSMKKLEEIRERREKEKGGLFKRMFK